MVRKKKDGKSKKENTNLDYSIQRTQIRVFFCIYVQVAKGRSHVIGGVVKLKLLQVDIVKRNYLIDLCIVL